MNPLQVAKPRIRLFHTLVAAVLAGIATHTLFYAEAHWWNPPVLADKAYFSWDVLRTKMLTFDPINWALIWTFFFGILHLIGTFFFVYLPLKLSSIHGFALVMLLEKRNSGQTLEPFEEVMINRASSSYFGQRLLRLQQFYVREKSLSEARAERDDMLAIDEEQLTLCFTPVSWSEVALPLLGFLGTVVGMSGALPAISNAVDVYLQTQDAQRTAPLLTDGFKKLAFAFDTTFTGLAGVIIIGLLHIALKSFLATRIAVTRKDLTDQMSTWDEISELKDRTLEVLVAQTNEITNTTNEVISTTNEIASTMNKRAELTMAILEHVFVHAEGQGFEAIRKTLFSVAVPFSENEQASEALERCLSTWGSNWHVVTCGFPVLPVATGIVVVRHGGADYRVKFQWSGEFRFESPQAVHGPISELVPSVDGTRYVAKSGDGLVLPASQEHEFRLATNEHLLPVSVGQKEVVIMLAKQPDDRTVVKCRLLNPSVEDYVENQDLDYLPDNYEWSVASSSPQHQTIVVIGRQQDGAMMLVKRLIEPKGKSDKRESLKWSDEDLKLQLRMSATGGREARQVIQISAKEFLVLYAKGSIDYWHVSTDRACPTRLSSDPNAELPWAGALEARILTNGRGSIAIIANQQISFWRVLRGGNLHRLSELAPFVGPQPGQVRVTADGRYFVGFHQRDLFVWNFPVYAIDSF